MTTSDNAAKARMGKLKKKADALGIPYDENTTEDLLRLAIKEFEPEEVEQNSSLANSIAVGRAVAEALAPVLKDIKKSEGPETGLDRRLVLEEDPEDVGEEKRYYTTTWFWILPAKRSGAQLVKAPYGQIVFKMQHGSSIRVGNQFNTQYVASYATKSKKEQAHMESHPLFNKVFYLDGAPDEITTDQRKFAQRFSAQYSNLGTKMAPELHRIAARLSEQGYAVNHSSSLSLHTLRTNIANALAEKDLKEAAAMEAQTRATQGRESLLSPNA